MDGDHLAIAAEGELLGDLATLLDRLTDAAFLWLPVDADGIHTEILVSEPRLVALSNRHRLAHREAVEFRELADDAFVALPRSAGSLREFWLGAPEGKTATVTVAAEATSADEKFEIISTGTAVALIAEGNAMVYSRPGIVCVPVTDLPPASLAVAWRRDDRRPTTEAFVRASVGSASDMDREGRFQVGEHRKVLDV